jgi:ABC-2 type transport system permease protein
MRAFTSIYKREVKSYFVTPIAYVFLVIFLVFSSFLTFQKGFFENREASLRLFFSSMPLLFLFLVPAIAMRLWAEERRSNSIEFLFTLPVTTAQAVLGKFFAAWTVLVLALALTFPMVLTVTHLGDPDPGPIVTGYLGSVLMAGAYLAIGSFFSAVTRNQVIAFTLAVVACGLFMYADSPSATEFVADHLSSRFADVMELLSFRARFESIQRGVMELRDLAFFVLLAAGWLWANIVLLEERKGA